jgi:hypothetical protein
MTLFVFISNSSIKKKNWMVKHDEYANVSLSKEIHAI